MRSKGTHDADVGSFGESESGKCDLWRQNKKINRVKRRTQKRNSVHRKKITDDVEGFIHDSRQHESTVKAKFAEIQEAQQKHHHESSLENFEIVLTQLKSCFERDESILQRNLTEEILQSHLAIRWTPWRTSECENTCHLWTSTHTSLGGKERRHSGWYCG